MNCELRDMRHDYELKDMRFKIAPALDDDSMVQNMDCSLIVWHIDYQISAPADSIVQVLFLL
jgi:hypothetical protein